MWRQVSNLPEEQDRASDKLAATEKAMIERRDFLKTSALLSLAPTVPAFLAQTGRAAPPERDAKVLVVIQLDGGNDGINTVVPHADEGYAKHRRRLRLVKNQLVKVTDSVGLHFSLREMGKLLEAGRLTIVQGVGYPNPSRSHFESMAVWQTARRDPKEHTGTGWLGRGLDAGKASAGGAPAMVFVGGGQLPLALRSRRSVASALTRPEDFVLDPLAKGKLPTEAETKDDLSAFVHRMAVEAQSTAERMKSVRAGTEGAYPDSELAQQLRLCARLIRADVGTRVFYPRQTGYDTHAAQFGTHSQLLGVLPAGLGAFLEDLERAKLAERVVVLMFSEFGRTVKENG